MNIFILLGASLVAGQIRTSLPWGNRLGIDYNPQPLLMIGLLVLIAAAGYMFGILAEQIPWLRTWLRREYPFRLLLLSLGIALLAIFWLTPEVSKLQIIYFTVISIILGLLLVVIVNRLTTPNAIAIQVWRMINNTFLIKLWLDFNIQVRYSQTMIGILWIMLLPLATSAVMAVAFSLFLKIQYDVPFISFILSALVPWNMFQNGILNSLQAVISKAGIINQVSFPREILVLLVGGELMIDTFFTFLVLLLVDALNGIWPNIYFLFLPYLFFILITFTLGLMFFGSSVTVFVRDVPQLVTVGLQLVFYLTPIVYPINSIPDQFKVLVLLNPMVSVIQAFRDVIVYGREPSMITLYYPFVVGITLLIVGYVFFKASEDRMADIL